jgi:PTS system fructose-specific IIC component
MSFRDIVRETMRTHLGNVRNDLSTGVSFIVPFVTIGGIVLAFGYAWANFFGGGIQTTSTTIGGVGWFLAEFGRTGLTAMTPVLGAAIAYSIAGRPGIAPGFMLTQIIQDGTVVKVTAEAMGLEASSSGAGYLGALVVGLATGHVALRLKSRDLPDALGTIKPFVIVPVGTCLLLLPVVLFVIGVPVAILRLELMHWISDIQGSQALVVGTVLGGMMAFDMGGPINKVAFVSAFELSLFGITEPMAAVMIAGMTPAIGMALSNHLAPHKYPEGLHQNAKSSAILGLAFVTEGAIPYAALDPLRVVPSLIAGSSAAGALSMYLGLEMPAPHGGIFVVSLANSPVQFLLVVLFGSVITAITVTALRPPETAAEQNLGSYQRDVAD